MNIKGILIVAAIAVASVIGVSMLGNGTVGGSTNANFKAANLITEGSLCVENGTNFTTLTFAADSVTPVYATSTTCQ